MYTKRMKNASLTRYSLCVYEFFQRKNVDFERICWGSDYDVGLSIGNSFDMMPFLMNYQTAIELFVYLSYTRNLDHRCQNTTLCQNSKTRDK